MQRKVIAHYLNWQNSSRCYWFASNLANINRIFITFQPCPLIVMERILPSLRKCSIVADMPVPWKHVGDIAKVVFLLILHDGVHQELAVNLKLGLAEPWDLHNHVVGLNIKSIIGTMNYFLYLGNLISVV